MNLKIIGYPTARIPSSLLLVFILYFKVLVLKLLEKTQDNLFFHLHHRYTYLILRTPKLLLTYGFLIEF